MHPVDLFNTAGAIVAFVTAIYTLWDRMLRDQPKLSIATQTIGENANLYLRITSVAEFDIFLREIFATPPQVSIAVSHSAQHMAHAASGEAAAAVIEPKGTRLFPLIVPSGFEADVAILITAEWERSTHRFFKPWPAKLHTSLSDLIARKRAAEGR